MLVKAIPSTGQPIELVFQWENTDYQMIWRKVPGTSEHDILFLNTQNKQYVPFRDRISLHQEQNRIRLGRQIAIRFRLPIQHVVEWIHQCYHLYCEQRAQMFQIHSYQTLSQTPRPVRFLIENWFPEHYITTIAGDGGIGKSVFAQLICLILGAQLSTPWSTASTFPLKWLYLDWENQNENYFYYRMSILAEAIWNKDQHLILDRKILEDGIRNGYYLTVQSPISECYSELTDIVQSYQPDLVVIDSASLAIQGSLNDEQNIREHMMMFYGWCHLPLTILLITHIAKEDVRLGTRIGPYGSRMFYNLSRQILEIKARKLKGHPQLTTINEINIIKNNYGKNQLEPVYFQIVYPNPTTQTPAEIILSNRNCIEPFFE